MFGIVILFMVWLNLQATPTLPLHQVRIYGNMSLGYYYIEVYIGTPPQKTSMIVDTGSGVTALPCDPCKQCGSSHLNPRYKVNSSSTSKYLTCVMAFVR